MVGGVPSVGPADVGPEAILLDVREDDEWVAGHVDGSRHIPMAELPARFAEVSDLAEDAATGEVVVVCRSGNRSARVVAWLNQNGVDAVNLVGGLGAWAAAGRTLVSETGGEPLVL
jgi:rhodanese-related sulfurtransferase